MQMDWDKVLKGLSSMQGSGQRPNSVAPPFQQQDPPPQLAGLGTAPPPPIPQPRPVMAPTLTTALGPTGMTPNVSANMPGPGAMNFGGGVSGTPNSTRPIDPNDPYNMNARNRSLGFY